MLGEGQEIKTKCHVARRKLGYVMREDGVIWQGQGTRRGQQAFP